MAFRRVALIGIIAAAVSGCAQHAQFAPSQAQLGPVPPQTSATRPQAAPRHRRAALASSRRAPFPARAANASTEAVATADGPHEQPAPTIDSLVSRRAHDLGVPVDLAQAVIGVESRGNPRATNHGAMGLMQIKVQTARAMGFQGSAAALLSPDTNLTYGMKVLAAAYRSEGGDVCRTLASYQSGHSVRQMTTAQRHYCARARLMMAKS